MSKSRPSKNKSLTISKPIIEHFSKFVRGQDFLPRKYNAVVGLDREKRPAWFLFDVLAFWDFVCRIDENLFDNLSEEAYERTSLGTLIDKLEEHWPFTPEFKKEIKKEYKAALKDISGGNLYSL